jgi:DNA-binding XRE family transcriptional regulator
MGLSREVKKEARARERVRVIMAVRSGQLTATEGARQLGVSRKTYYEWERRGLEAMVKAIQDQEAGRPHREVDREKEELKVRVRGLEQEIEMAKKTDVLRRMLNLYEERKRQRENRGKKNRSSRKR